MFRRWEILSQQSRLVLGIQGYPKTRSLSTPQPPRPLRIPPTPEQPARREDLTQKFPAKAFTLVKAARSQALEKVKSSPKWEQELLEAAAPTKIPTDTELYPTRMRRGLQPLQLPNFSWGDFIKFSENQD